MTMQMAALSTVSSVRLAKRWLRAQALVAAALALVLLILVGRTEAASSLYGGFAVLIPSIVFALIVAPRFGGDSGAFLRSAVLAESAKWFLTAAICAATFIWAEPLAAGWFFVGMGAVLLAGWAGLIFGK
jgi:F0F1-type ATP synthase assembly protein I